MLNKTKANPNFAQIVYLFIIYFYKYMSFGIHYRSLLRSKLNGGEFIEKTRKLIQKTRKEGTKVGVLHRGGQRGEYSSEGEALLLRWRVHGG